MLIALERRQHIKKEGLTYRNISPTILNVYIVSIFAKKKVG